MEDKSQNPQSSGFLPIPGSYQSFIQNEWADIHHSRMQEWSALGAVTGVHLALTQIPKVLKEISIPIEPLTIWIITPFFGLLFAVVGILVTCRHRRLMFIKLNWIYQAEEKIGLIKCAENPAGIIPAIAQMPKTKE